MWVTLTVCWSHYRFFSLPVLQLSYQFCRTQIWVLWPRKWSVMLLARCYFNPPVLLHFSLMQYHKHASQIWSRSSLCCFKNTQAAFVTQTNKFKQMIVIQIWRVKQKAFVSSASWPWERIRWFSESRGCKTINTKYDQWRYKITLLCRGWELASLRGRLYRYSPNLWILTGLVIVLWRLCFFRQVQWALELGQQKGGRFLQDSVRGCT